jgi:hypothetical protein
MLEVLFTVMAFKVSRKEEKEEVKINGVEDGSE